MAEETLADKIEQNQIAAEKAQNQKNQQQRQQQLQQSQQYQQYLKEKEEYEKQVAEYERQVQQLEAQQKAEDARIAAEKAKAEQLQKDRQQVIDKYDSQINNLIKRRSSTRKEPKYYTNRYTGHRRIIGYRNVPLTQGQIRNINGRIRVLKSEKSTALQRLDFSANYSGITLGGTWYRDWQETSGRPGTMSLSQAYERELRRRESQKQRAREVSIKNAKADAIKARENHEKTIREFESKRDSLGIKLNEGQIRLAQLKEPQKATKSRPQVVTSSYFEDTKNTPSSIYGRTKQESNKAETTYETAQQQQKSLFDKVTGAASWNEAIRIRKQSMESNPYLGTANTLFHKGKAIGSSGALLSLSLETISLDGVTEESLFTRRKKEKDFLDSLGDNERLNYGRNKNGDLVLLSDDSLAVPEIQLEQSHSQPEPRFTVTTPDGKIRTFKDEKTADEFIERTRGSYKTSPSAIFTSDGEELLGPPRPHTETSYYIPGALDHIFYDERKQRLQEEIAIAGGAYGDYLKTVNLDSFDSQLKFVGKGAKRAFNSYTSIVGVQLHNSKVAGHSLLDYVISDTYNSLYAPVIKPVSEKLNLKLPAAPANPKPFQQTSKAWNSRTPAENAGDIITTGAVEAGLFVGTAGIGNLAIRGAGKLPYLLKTKIPTATQYLKSQKESQLATIRLEDGTKVKLTNFDYVEPTKPLPNKPLLGVLVNSYLGRKVGINFPDTQKLSNAKNKFKNSVLIPNPVLAIEKKIINNDAIRKIATKRLPTKDKGKPPKGESGLEYGRSNDYKLPGLEDKTKSSIKETTKKPAKNKPVKSQTQNQRQSRTQVVVEEIRLHPNRPQIKTTEPKINLALPAHLQSPRIDVSNSMIEKVRTSLKPKISLEHSSKLKQNADEQLSIKNTQKIDTKLDDIQKQRRKLETRFSLTVKHGSRQKEEFEERYGLKTAQKFSQRLDESLKIPTVPVSTGIKIPGIEEKKQSRKSRRGGRLRKGFYRWNTDTERVGVYLPTADLHTGKTGKVIRKVDEFQRKTHTKSYQKRKQRRQDKFWSFDLKSNQNDVLFKPRRGLGKIKLF